MNISGIWDNIFKEKKEEIEKNVIDVIEGVPLFEDLNFKELRNAARLAYVRHYETGEDIIKEGQSSAGLYIIMNGEVEIAKQTKEGVKTVLANLKQDDSYPIFGELGLVDNSPRTATVTAIESTDVIGFFRPELLKLINEDPKTASKLIFKLVQIVAKRLRYTDEKLSKMTEEVEQLNAKTKSKEEDKAISTLTE